MAAPQSILNEDLNAAPIEETIKRSLASSMWECDLTQTARCGDKGALPQYFRYYTAQVDGFFTDRGRNISIRKHQHLIDIIFFFRQGKTKDEICNELRRTSSSPYLNDIDTAIKGSIDLAVRLLLMLEISHMPNGLSSPHEVRWEHDCLQCFVAKQFEISQTPNQEKVRLEETFVARNFERMANIKIEWTNNIADHLRMHEYDTKVTIFHHASFLQMARNDSIFPGGFIEETLRSLALLLPEFDRKTRRWFEREASLKDLDLKAIRCGRLRGNDRQIQTFSFWYDRLIVLKQAFDESELETWSQWCYDTRRGRGVNRYPLLIAAIALVLTALFGLIQCVEGALQVYKSYHPSSSG